MSDYKPIQKFRWWIDEEPTYQPQQERVVIVDGDLRARVIALEAENARLHTLADAWAGVTAEKQEAESRAAELDSRLTSMTDDATEIDATLNALPAEALALWSAYEAEHEAAMSLRNTETRDAIDDWHRACAAVEAAKRGER